MLHITRFLLCGNWKYVSVWKLWGERRVQGAIWAAFCAWPAIGAHFYSVFPLFAGALPVRKGGWGAGGGAWRSPSLSGCAAVGPRGAAGDAAPLRGPQQRRAGPRPPWAPRRRAPRRDGPGPCARARLRLLRRPPPPPWLCSCCWRRPAGCWRRPRRSPAATRCRRRRERRREPRWGVGEGGSGVWILTENGPGPLGETQRAGGAAPQADERGRKGSYTLPAW